MMFSVLHTSARPVQWRKVYDAWIGAAAHPEQVEYVLCVDERWGFVPDNGMGWAWDGARRLNKLVYNHTPYKHSGYVSGVNLAAKAATGDVLIVIADDFLPVENWDAALREQISLIPKPFAEFVIWTRTGTPGEIERRIMPHPVLSRSRFERLGYVFYPLYESMYADNDFCEHAHADADAFPDRWLVHSYNRLDREVQIGTHHWKGIDADPAYQAQNHPEAYAWGKRVLDARRAANFGPVQMIEQKPRKITLAVLGETFDGRWVDAYGDLLGHLGHFHDVTVMRGYSTQVWRARASAAKKIIEAAKPPEIILWIDDDNPPAPHLAEQLILDLESHQNIGMVAGWTMTTLGGLSFGVIEDKPRRYLDADPEAFKRGPDLQRCHWTGFPMVAMRFEMLKSVGWEGFAPIRDENIEEDNDALKFLGEDVGFCTVAINWGWEIWVDRRVKLEHLKVTDINR